MLNGKFTGFIKIVCTLTILKGKTGKKWGK